MFGIIGGSGLYDLVRGKEKRVSTKYGMAIIVLGELSTRDYAFVARHGRTHSIPPHKINHKANIQALKEIGVSDLLSVCSVGAIGDYAPGDLVVVRDFISLGQPNQTFFDDFSDGLRHADMTEPYNKKLSDLLLKTARECGIKVRDCGILAHTHGPRFETKAEIGALRTLGANLVGMTSVPEAILANELGIRFANIAIVSNYAADLSKKPLTVKEIMESVGERKEDIRKITRELAKVI